MKAVNPRHERRWASDTTNSGGKAGITTTTRIIYPSNPAYLFYQKNISYGLSSSELELSIRRSVIAGILEKAADREIRRLAGIR
jgi:hypothetical protein